MRLSLPASLSARGVSSTYDVGDRSTVLAQPCFWCLQSISVRVDDRALIASRDMRAVVIEALDRSRARHLAVHRCATAGHDPGDEDPGEDLARSRWRPA
jgi:hypothetical protein